MPPVKFAGEMARDKVIGQMIGHGFRDGMATERITWAHSYGVSEWLPPKE